MGDTNYKLRYLPLFYRDLEGKIAYIAETLQDPQAANDLLDDDMIFAVKFRHNLPDHEVCLSVFFRCIMFLPYRVTFLCNVLCQIHYASGNPVRYFFIKKL